MSLLASMLFIKQPDQFCLFEATGPAREHMIGRRLLLQRYANHEKLMVDHIYMLLYLSLSHTLVYHMKLRASKKTRPLLQLFKLKF